VRVLFSTTPALGHLLPMLPLAAAARRAGHETALLSHPSMGEFAPGMRLLPAGPSTAETLADVERRTGVDALEDVLRGAVEFFVESRLRLGADDALAAARGFGPDLVVADMVDFLGQLSAAALGVPWAAHGASLPLVEPLAAAFEQAAGPRFTERGATRTQPVAFVDPWPAGLLRPTDVHPAERIAVRPEPPAGEGEAWSRPRFAGREDRPLVLVTLGTVVEDPDTLAAVLASLAHLDVNVLAAPHSAADLGAREVDRTRVHLTGFVPMKDLLNGVDVVVSTAGAGTVLSALSAGLPMVLLPMGLDKPVNAERAAAAGAARVVTTSDEVGAAVEKVLADPSFAAAAATVAAEIAGMNSADEALELLLGRARGR
jgi:UDP:flavonoid glycosyltransferase YjiC (YdhE family)